MNRLLELVLGLDTGFLGREGEFSLRFAPHWPLQDYIGAGLWTFVLCAAGLALVVYVYRREGRSRPARITLAVLRGALIALVIALLNRPVLTLTQSHAEPSVVAVLVDDSVSMKVPDMASGSANAQSRLRAAVQLLDGQDQALLRELSKEHELRFYRFDDAAQPMGLYVQPSSRRGDVQQANDQVLQSLRALEPTGQHTQLLGALRTVLEELQGQRLAGVILLSDGRETPSQPMAQALDAIRDYGVKVFPVALGTDQRPRNIDIQSVNLQDSAFVGDIVNVKAMVRASGYEAGHAVVLRLRNKRTLAPLVGADGRPVEKSVTMPDGGAQEIELQFKPAEAGAMDVVVEADKQPGELDDQDNSRTEQISVLDARIAVLYVDGYPRWDYRYIKNEMVRDKTVDISCLLTSADPGFAQEGDRPIRRFPESIQEMLDYDVILFGDVDPRQFTDYQLQLVNEFVSQKGGGFGMVAGPRWSPQAFRNTAIEPLLPVSISRVEPSEGVQSLTEAFRPVLTREGAASSVFRFLADRTANDQFVKEQWQPVFWYCRGIAAKPGVGEVYAEHPSETGPDGRKAPLYVVGRYGAGRTMFAAYDDSWRWRFYTGEQVFDTYWVQSLRYLARSRKLGQRRITLTSMRPGYELGEQIQVNLKVLDPQLLQQLPEQLRVEVDDADGLVIRNEPLVRQEAQPELYAASWTADRTGRFVVKLPPVGGGTEALELPIDVATPRLELANPQVDRTMLARLASETLGQTVDYGDARTALPHLITSAAKVIPVEASQPLWGAPLAMVLFMVLLTAEWILRKMYGML